MRAILVAVVLVTIFSQNALADDEVAAASSTVKSENSESTTTEKSKPKEEDSQNELIGAINSSLVTINSRVSNLESQIATLTESKSAVDLRGDISQNLKENKAKLRKLEQDFEKMNSEFADLSYEYKRTLGKVGGDSTPSVRSNDQETSEATKDNVKGPSGGVPLILTVLKGEKQPAEDSVKVIKVIEKQEKKSEDEEATTTATISLVEESVTEITIKDDESSSNNKE